MGGSYYDIPRYMTDGAAAIDIRSTEEHVIYSGETRMISTGLAIWIGTSKPSLRGVCPSSTTPLQIAGLLVPRSSLGTKGLVLANTIGVIDSDYQGELKIAAWNRTPATCGSVAGTHIKIKPGDRIAQLMFVPVLRPQCLVVEEFGETTGRGAGGFGSTGSD